MLIICYTNGTQKDVMKVCNKCAETKPLTEFFKDKAFKDGHSSICKVCKTKSIYLWRQNNPRKYNGGAKKWRDKNPDKQHANDIKRHYGLLIDDYNRLLVEQGNGCKICKKQHTADVKRGRLYVDHDHATGKIRGLLCGACNSALGYFCDNIDLLLEAVKYLKSTK